MLTILVQCLELIDENFSRVGNESTEFDLLERADTVITVTVSSFMQHKLQQSKKKMGELITDLKSIKQSTPDNETYETFGNRLVSLFVEFIESNFVSFSQLFPSRPSFCIFCACE